MHRYIDTGMTNYCVGEFKEKVSIDISFRRYGGSPTKALLYIQRVDVQTTYMEILIFIDQLIYFESY